LSKILLPAPPFPSLACGGRLKWELWRRRRAACVLTIALLSAPVVFAKDKDDERPTTILHLSQTAERNVLRDLLRIELRVEATGPDAASVQSEINRRMAAALERARGVPGVKVETGFYNVAEERPEHEPARWRGGQSVVLTGKDAASMLKLAGELQADGLSTSSLAYETSPETVRGAEEDLTAEALAELDHRAAEIAERMHLAVLRYRDLRVGNAETGGRPVPRFAAMTAAPPVAEPGEAVVRVTVEADLLLTQSGP
jgi:uncharacterized protein